MKLIGNQNWFLYLPEFEIGGKVVKEDDRYVVKDNTTLKNLVLSSTRLTAKKETRGHKHKGQEEIYKDGKEDGLWTVWYENGQKVSEGTYKDGKKDGKYTYWYKN